MSVLDLNAKIGLDDSDYKEGIKNLGVIGQAAGKIIADGFEKAVSAVASFASDSIKAGAAFDSSMSQVAATMGITNEELNNNIVSVGDFTGSLRDFAQEMGSTTAFSASQAADALNYMALAGYDAATSVSMLPNVLNLAAAGGIELAAASDMVTDASSALGLDIEHTTLMVDQMAAASSKSNTSVAQLGEAFLAIGGTAKNLSGGTVELSQTLGILADNGIKGSEAGTHLRNIMLSLTPSTDAAAEAFEQLGVQAYDSEGNMRNMSDIFGEMSAAMDGMSSEEKTNIISAMFNKTDISSVNALLATSADRWDELGAAIDDSAGAAEAMANTQLDNLNGDITLLQSALEGAQIAVSDALTPALREFVQLGADGLSQLTSAFQEDGLAGAVDVFGDLLSNGLQMILDGLPEAMDAGFQVLGAIGQGIIDNLPLMADSAIEILVNLANGISENLPELVPTIIDVILNIVDTLTNNMGVMADAAINLMLGLTMGLVNAIPELVDRVPMIIMSIVTALYENRGKILNAGVTMLLSLARGIISAIPRLVVQIPTVARAAINAFKTNLVGIKDVGVNLVKGLWEGIGDMVGWITDKIKGFGENILSGIKSFFGIHSPSTLMRDEIGKNLALGVAVGWEDEFPAIKQSIEHDIIAPDMNAVSYGNTGGRVDNSSWVINVYGSANMSVNELADAVADKINRQVRNKRTVMA